MILYCFLLFFTVAVTGLVLKWAGGRHTDAAGGEPLSGINSDISIYRSQMAEIESEKKRGLLDDESADEARLELARRMLAAERKGAGSKTDSGNSRIAGNRRGVAFRLFISLAILFIPLFAWGVYSKSGSPHMSAHPFSLLLQRDPATLDAAEKLVRTEVLANRNPQNGRLVDELADLYLDAGRFQDAVNTGNRAIAMNGESAARLLRYAIALTGFEEGVVSREAEDIFRKVTVLDPKNPEAWIFLARGLIQNGKESEAIKLLEDFLQTAPQNAAWRQNIADVVARMKQERADRKKTGGAGSTGSAATVADTGITPQQRRFVADNVGKLAARLEQAPDDLQGWMMLINAWLVLGKPDAARASLKRGLSLLSSDKAGKLSAFARAKGFAQGLDKGPAQGLDREIDGEGH